MLNETASAANPTLCPNRADTDTGIGWAAGDDFSLVAGGVNLVKIDDDNGTANTIAQNSSATIRPFGAWAASAAFTGDVAIFTSNTTASGFNYMTAYADIDGTPDLEFKLAAGGNGTCDGSWTGSGADYAEMFEWEDGNPLDEDRRGITVTLVGGKVKPAQTGDVVIGVVSSKPNVIGNASALKWVHKWEQDAYGAYLWGEHEVSEMVFVNGPLEDVKDVHGRIAKEAGKRHTTWVRTENFKPHVNGKRWLTGATKMQKHKILNPDFDPALEYIPRTERKEWATIGLMGQIWVRDGQPVDMRWMVLEQNVSAGLTRYLVR
jgi:hypothetical protein